MSSDVPVIDIEAVKRETAQKKALETTRQKLEKTKLIIPVGVEMKGPRVLVQAVSVKRTKQGLYLPDNVSERENECEGTIVAVGPGYRRVKDDVVIWEPITWLKVNDRVVFQFAGIVPVTIGDVTYLAIDEGFIVCKLPDEVVENDSR